MTRRLAFVVEDHFAIAWGLTLSTSARPALAQALAAGTQLTLVRPDGSRGAATVGGIPMGGTRGYSVTLEGQWSKEDVPIGTEVWVDAPEG